MSSLIELVDMAVVGVERLLATECPWCREFCEESARCENMVGYELFESPDPTLCRSVQIALINSASLRTRQVRCATSTLRSSTDGLRSAADE